MKLKTLLRSVLILLIASTELSAETKNDPFYNSQWTLRANNGSTPGTGIANAWAQSTGSEDITIAVLDSGVLNHNDLNTRLLPGYDFVSDLATAADGDGRDIDPTDPGNWVTDDMLLNGDYPLSCGRQPSSWHGTKVASLIGAVANNDLGIAGADKHAYVLPVRTTGRCGGTESDLIDAIRWAAGYEIVGVPSNVAPADVIQLSVGRPGLCSAALQSAIDDARQFGAIVVAAAGNANGQSRNRALQFAPMTPAVCDGVITVAALANNSTLAGYSFYGDQVDLVAPGGEEIYGIPMLGDSGSSTAKADNAIQSDFGTSFAAPHVAATLALMMSHNPDLSSDQLVERLLTTATASTDPLCQLGQCGAGLLNAEAAVIASTPSKSDAMSSTAIGNTGGASGGGGLFGVYSSITLITFLLLGLRNKKRRLREN